MARYDSAAVYIESASSIRQKITRLDAIIDALLTTVLKSAENGDVQEYWLNDGQTQIKTSYRSAKEVLDAVNVFERTKQIYVNRLNGRVMRLVDGKNFIG